MRNKRTIRLLATALISVALVPSTPLPQASAAKVKLVAKRTQVKFDEVPANGAPVSPPGQPFKFKDYKKLKKIKKVKLTFTMYDGDTGPGEFDEGNLVLLFDTTGPVLTLDGFRSDETTTLTITQEDPVNADALLDNLKDDGKIVATIAKTAGPTNFLWIPEGFVTKLVLIG